MQWRARIVGLSTAVILLVAGVALPVTLNLSSELLTVMWVLIAVLLLVVAVLATGLRTHVARFLTASDAQGQDDARIVHIASLVSPGDPVLRGHVFEGKTIVGPALLLAGDDMVVDHCVYHFRPGALMWEFDPQRVPVGAIRLEGCAFRNCEFIAVGFAGTKADIEKARLTFPDA
jgi:hypothetical protein